MRVYSRNPLRHLFSLTCAKKTFQTPGSNFTARVQKLLVQRHRCPFVRFGSWAEAVMIKKLK